jgi:GNAT superfamily N-acetyltransferase
MEITVRRAEPSDSLPPGVAHKLPEPLLESKRREGRVLLAFVRGQPVGWLVWTLLWARLPFIELLYVEPNDRRLGVAAAMLAALERELVAGGRGLLLSSTQDDNPGALSWHLEQGFEESGVLDGVNPGDIGEVFLRKALS